MVEGLMAVEITRKDMSAGSVAKFSSFCALQLLQWIGFSTHW